MKTLFAVFYPLKTISALNAREHWAARAKRVEAEKLVTRAALNKACENSLEVQPEIIRTHLSGRASVIVLTRSSAGTLDTDNLASAMKGVRDAVAKWLGVDDGPKGPRWVYRQEKVKRGEYFVRIEFCDSFAVANDDTPFDADDYARPAK